jgi:hypothetical protein
MADFRLLIVDGKQASSRPPRRLSANSAISAFRILSGSPLMSQPRYDSDHAAPA